MKVVITTAFLALLLSSAGLVHAANAERGQQLVEKGNCASCHGAGLKAPILPAYPKLAGQYPDYIFYALRAYQIGGSNPLFGRVNAIMSTQVQPFTTNDLQDIAEYISSLPSDFVVKK